ncbi:hypothetical protein MHK_001917, partial [Candidatus Magnetomorum sp. HK-1]
MNITDPEIIERGERDLMDGIIADLDWGAIESIFKDRHRLNIEDDVEYQEGDLIIHNDQVAYELKFQVKLNLSVLCGRDGEYIAVKSSLDIPEENESPEIQSLKDNTDDDKQTEKSELPEQAIEKSDIKEEDELEADEMVMGIVEESDEDVPSDKLPDQADEPEQPEQADEPEQPDQADEPEQPEQADEPEQ